MGILAECVAPPFELLFGKTCFSTLLPIGDSFGDQTVTHLTESCAVANKRCLCTPWCSYMSSCSALFSCLYRSCQVKHSLSFNYRGPLLNISLGFFFFFFNVLKNMDLQAHGRPA